MLSNSAAVAMELPVAHRDVTGPDEDLRAAGNGVGTKRPAAAARGGPGVGPVGDWLPQ